VDALGGMPGVLSARWAGRHGDDRANLDLVLGQLADVPDDRRGAAFVCAAALVVPGGQEVVVHGEWTGRLARAPRGTGGFGYDPVFVPDGETRTSAELAPQEKDALSHRGRAMRALLPHLRALGG
jgi:XTP/dITP diphosphohydrolase